MDIKYMIRLNDDGSLFLCKVIERSANYAIMIRIAVASKKFSQELNDLLRSKAMCFYKHGIGVKYGEVSFFKTNPAEARDIFNKCTVLITPTLEDVFVSKPDKVDTINLFKTLLDNAYGEAYE